jgi:alanine dehydrogenase
VNAVGAPPRPDYREIDTEGTRRSRVVVDSFQMASKKSGDLLIPLSEGAISQSHFGDELGHVITGRAAGRASEGDTRLYKSVGLCIQDIAAARLVLAAARKRSVGTEIMLGS